MVPKIVCEAFIKKKSIGKFFNTNTGKFRAIKIVSYLENYSYYNVIRSILGTQRSHSCDKRTLNS